MSNIDASEWSGQEMAFFRAFALANAAAAAEAAGCHVLAEVA